MLQMFGQPYHPNTLVTVPPDTEAMINRVRLLVLFQLGFSLGDFGIA
jgi:hypothetical protein